MKDKKLVTLKELIDRGVINIDHVVISEVYENGDSNNGVSVMVSDYLNHEVIGISLFSSNTICVKVKSKKDNRFIPKDHYYITDVKIDDKLYEKNFTSNSIKTSSVVGKSVKEIINRIYLTNIKVDPSQIKLVVNFNRSYAINLYTYILDQLKMDSIINNEDKLADIISEKFKDLIADSMNTTTRFTETSQVRKTNYTIFINMKEKDNLNAINWIINQFSTELQKERL